jgi:hypothetical protein
MKKTKITATKAKFYGVVNIFEYPIQFNSQYFECGLFTECAIVNETELSPDYGEASFCNSYILIYTHSISSI